jgi:small subunit ribosomal protein MRP21
MELRKAADALLRCQGSPLAALLTPSCSIQWQVGKQLTSPSFSHISHRRTFVTMPPRSSLKLAATTTAAPATSEVENASSEEGKPTRTNIDEAAKNLGWLQGSGSKFGGSGSFNPQTQKQNLGPSPVADSLARERELRMNGGSSADDILQSINRTFSSPSSSSSGGIDISRMQDPLKGNRPESAADLMSAINRAVALPKRERIPIRLSPSTGKTVKIDGNIDVARAFKLMEQTCGRNKVRRDFNYQRFHERRGLKKKRLRAERWRRRFMEGFRATVGRVKKLRRQGW